MKNPAIFRSFLGLTLFGLGTAAGSLAPSSTDSPQRVEIQRTDLSGAPGMEVITSTVEIKPKESLILHSHPGVEAFYVLQGAMVQAPGKEPMMLPTGRSQLNLRDVKHGGWKVVGDTSLKLFTVHVVDKGKPLYDSAEARDSGNALSPNRPTTTLCTQNEPSSARCTSAYEKTPFFDKLAPIAASRPTLKAHPSARRNLPEPAKGAAPAADHGPRDLR